MSRSASSPYSVHIESRLSPKRTALIIVDMQYHDAHPDFGFCLGMEKLSPGSMEYYNARLERITVPTIISLIELFRSIDLPVIYLLLGSDYEDYHDMSSRISSWQLQFEKDCGIKGMLWKGSPMYRVRDDLKPGPKDISLMKRTYGGFASTNLEDLLRAREIESLVITGVTTGACPETTGREAFDRGFATVMVDDALCDTNEERHKASLATFRANFGDVLKDASELRRSLSSGRE